MRTLVLVLTILVLAGSTASVTARQRQRGGVGLTVFTEQDFGGRSATFRDDTPNLQDSGFNDRIVSLRVARGEQWEVCEHARYRGRCLVVSREEPDLSRNGWSNTISSLRRVERRETNSRGESDAAGLVLFARPGFAGERRRVQSAVADLSDLEFDDRAMSLRVGRGEAWEVCAETRYRGCRTIDEDVPDIRDLELRGRISSVRPRY